MRKKRTRVLLCSEWKVLLEKSWGRTNEKQDIFYDRFGKHIWCSIVGLKLKVGQKHKKGGGMLAVIDHVLTVLDGLVSWTGCCGNCGSKFYCHIWSDQTHLYIQPLIQYLIHSGDYLWQKFLQVYQVLGI